MPDTAPKMNAATLLSELGSAGYQVDNATLTDFIRARNGRDRIPLYQHVLVGVGAFFLFFFFSGFVAMAVAAFSSPENSFIFFGVVLGLIAIGLLSRSSTAKGASQSFLIQLSSISMLVGKGLIIVGLIMTVKSIWTVPAAFLILAVATWHLYPVTLDRYLNSLAVPVSLVFSILFEKHIPFDRAFLFYGIFLALLLIAAFMIRKPAVRILNRPLFYAALTGLCFMVLFLATQFQINIFDSTKFIFPFPAKVMLAVGLVALIIGIAGGLRSIRTEPVILSLAGVLALGYLSTSGILLSIAMMLFGHAYHERMSLIMGTILMPLFLIQFYYNMDITLLYKSGILGLSGAVLLLGWGYIRLRGWEHGAAA